MLPSKEYWAEGQWNRERLKEQWTGKDAHITLNTLAHGNRYLSKSYSTLR